MLNIREPSEKINGDDAGNTAIRTAPRTASGLEFWDVLPNDGLYCLVSAGANGQPNRPMWQSSKAELEATVARAETARQEMWFAYGAFNAKERTQAAVRINRAFVFDIDVAPPTHDANGNPIKPKLDKAGNLKCYPTKKDALRALKSKVLQKLPRPTFIVDSGYGYHLYWLIADEAGGLRYFEPEAWKATAERFKALLKEADPILANDTTRVADGAGILRAPGSWNKKYGFCRPVTLKLKGRPCSLGDFTANFPALATGAPVAKPSRTRATPRINLGGVHTPPPDGDAESFLKCKAVEAYRKRQDTAGRDEWRPIMQMCAYVDGGHALAHKLSQGAAYDPGGVDREFANAARAKADGQAPIKCETLCGALSLDRTTACNGCPLLGKATSSPVNLGRSRQWAPTASLPAPVSVRPSTATPWGAQGVAVGAHETYPVYPNTADGGSPASTCENAEAFLLHYGVELRRNEFDRNDYATRFGETRKADDDVMNHLRIEAEKTGLRVKKADWHDYCREIARKGGFHPVRDYLDGLNWDGVPRLDTWLTAYLGADDTPLNRAVGRIVLVAAVRRVRHPGTKFDQLLVLEGGQGTGKSTAVRLLASDPWFTDCASLGDDPKVVIEQTIGKWVVEVAELTGMGRRDVEAIKAQLSRTADRARLAYERAPVEVHRQFIMVGTTNAGGDDAYLRDVSGNRRFWPVAVGQIGLDAIETDRDQLWAEAAAREANGESILLPIPLRADAEAEQKKRLVTDPNEDWLVDLLAASSGAMESEQLLLALGLTRKDATARHHDLIKRATRRAGWSAYRRKGQSRGFANNRAGPDLIFSGRGFTARKT